MKIKLSTIITLGSLAAVAILCLRYCGGPDGKYWVARAEYDRAVDDRDKALAEAMAQLIDADAVISSEQAIRQTAIEEQERLRCENKTLRARDAELAAANNLLRTELQPVIDANPKLKELIQGYDRSLANKDEQIANLTMSYVQAKGEAEANYKSFLAAQVKATTWEEQYNQEHALRMTCDDLRTSLEGKYKRAGFWASVGKWGPPVTFCLGLVLGGGN